MDTPREPKEHRKASARTLKPANYNLIIDYRLGPALGVAARHQPPYGGPHADSFLYWQM